MILQLMTNKDILMALGQKIRDIRLYRKLSQKNLAKACGMSISTLQKIEGTGSKPNRVGMHHYLNIFRHLNMLGDLEHLLAPMPASPYQVEAMLLATASGSDNS